MTDRTDNTPMNIARLDELADRYGASLAHWPREEARAARLLLAESRAARAVLTRANRLDGILSETRKRSVSVNLQNRLLAAAPEAGWREFLTSLWPFGPVWRPATALFGIAMFGIFLGSTDLATLGIPISVNGALSEEIRVVGFSVAEILDGGASWRE